jgi:hypothetical protein
MSETEAGVRRVLQVKFRTPTEDATQLVALLQTTLPFYRVMGGGEIRLFRNVDDRSQFIQVLTYEMPNALEMNRQQFASQPAMQGLLLAWRTAFPTGVEIDVYEELVIDG